MVSNKACWGIAFLLGMQMGVSAGMGQARLRKARVGDRLEPFTLTNLEGEESAFEHRDGHVSVLVFLAPHQKQSERVLEELRDIVSSLRREAQAVDVVAIIGGDQSKDYDPRRWKELKLDFPILIDQEYQVWGGLGIIATPTVVVADKKGGITWIKAGHGYDFARAARSELAQALGLAAKAGDEGPGKVETLVNGTARDRALRHMKMAQLLAQRGRIDAAMAEFRKAEALVPEAVEVRLELGQLMCRIGEASKALAAVAKLDAPNRTDKARARMLAGWAYRQLGDHARAEKLLRESVDLDPKSVRALYELGKAYHSLGQGDKAIEAYDRALAVHFGEAPFSPTPKSGEAKNQDSRTPASRPR